MIEYHVKFEPIGLINKALDQSINQPELPTYTSSNTCAVNWFPINEELAMNEEIFTAKCQ